MGLKDTMSLTQAPKPGSTPASASKSFDERGISHVLPGTVPSESIHTPQPFPHVVVLQPELKMDSIDFFVCVTGLHTQCQNGITFLLKCLESISIQPLCYGKLK
jgi:hypothetical protein